MAKNPPTKTKKGNKDRDREIDDDDFDENDCDDFDGDDFDGDDEFEDEDDGEEWKGPRKTLVDIEVKGGRINTVTLSAAVKISEHDREGSRIRLREIITLLQDSIPLAELRGLDENHLENIPLKGWDETTKSFVNIPQKAREAWALQKKLKEFKQDEQGPPRPEGQ